MKKVLSAVCLLAYCATVSGTMPVGYYADCEGKKGEALLSGLHSVVGNHTVVSYNGLLDLYLESDVDENGKIWDMYSTKRWNPNEQCGTYKGVGDCYNREHSFPKSWFNNTSPMNCDAFHVYPTDGKVNGQRSNFPYGECAGGTTLSASGGIKALGRLGSSTFAGYSGTVFEPDDEYKGDFARSYFYMAAAYNNRIASWNSDMLDGTSYPAFTGWAINLLLKWHRQDPVSDKEINRNEAVYAAQHNRNPFIDYPELAEYIWGSHKTEQWYAKGEPEPTLQLPVEGSTVDFGLTAVNYTLSRLINVKGSELKEALKVECNDNAFKLSKTSITAAEANKGTSLSVSLKSGSKGLKTANLRIYSSEVSVTVTLKAEVVDGIPALPASDITETSFTANWISLGDADTYALTVKRGGSPLPGYPVDVYADNEFYEVSELEPDTEYSYCLASGTMQSNEVVVRTSAPIPSISYLVNSDIELSAEPYTPSEAFEVWIDVENIETSITASVNAPFELSTNHLNWSESIEIVPGEDRFYLRIGAVEVGYYSSAITLTAGSYVNDNAEVEASVREASESWFYEDFETADKQEFTVSTYNDINNYKGRVCDWNMRNAGIWEADSDKNGRFSLRLGKTNSSSITSASPKHKGIGTVSFYACRWSASDGTVGLVIEYSADGSEWKEGAVVVIDTEEFKQYSVPVKVVGTNYIRLRQRAGARGNIDDIVVSDYESSSVDCDLVDTWDAYCLEGELVITNNGPQRSFTVYDLEGRKHFESELGEGSVSVSLGAGLYIVTEQNDSRRVVIK